MSARGTAWAWGALALAAAVAAGVALERIERALRPPLPGGLAPPPAGQGVVTVALGGFRGIAADLLWLRASRLQDEGRYVELSQLAEWIAALEPHCTPVWAYHAWNMAYNIGSMMTDPADRWHWVRNGLRLLQERGLAANASDPAMYAEIGWMLLHKVGGALEGGESPHPGQWAEELNGVLPGGRLPPPNAAEAAGAAARLRAGYRMDLDAMRRLASRYGDLDWRSPYAHAAYWGAAGRDLAPGRSDLPCERVLYQALMHAFFAGTPAAGAAGQPAPRMELLDGVFKALDEVAVAHPGDAGVREAARGFAEGAVLLLHAAGREPDARRVYQTRVAQGLAADRPASDFDAFVGDVARVEHLPPVARRAVLAMNMKGLPQ